MKMRKEKHLLNSGFTLVELLIALTIFSVISLGLYSTFSSGISVWRRSEDANRIYQEARLALEQMAREIKSVVAYDFSDKYPEIKAFEGDENKFSFLIAANSGLKRVSFVLKEPGQIHISETKVNYQKEMPSSIIARFQGEEVRLMNLVKQEISLAESLGSQEPKSEDESTLTALVVPGGLSFNYANVGLREGETDISWENSWKQNNIFPAGVKINLMLANPKKPNEVVSFSKTVFIPSGTIFLSE